MAFNFFKFKFDVVVFAKTTQITSRILQNCEAVKKPVTFRFETIIANDTTKN